MQVGVWIPNCRHLATPEIIRHTAVRAEAARLRLGVGERSRGGARRQRGPDRRRHLRSARDPRGGGGRDEPRAPRHHRADRALPQPGGDRQDGLLARRALRRARDPGRGRGVAGGGERGARRAVRGARPDDRRVPGRDAGALDEPRAVLRGQVHPVQRAQVRAQAGAEAASRRSGWAATAAPRCAARPRSAPRGTRSTAPPRSCAPDAAELARALRGARARGAARRSRSATTSACCGRAGARAPPCAAAACWWASRPPWSTASPSCARSASSISCIEFLAPDGAELDEQMALFAERVRPKLA